MTRVLFSAWPMDKAHKLSRAPFDEPVRPFTHIIFDWSGTLADDHAASFLATRATIQHFSNEFLTKEDYERYFELPVEPFYRRYDQTTPFETIDRHYFQTFERYLHRASLLPDVHPLLAYLSKKKVTLSIFSTVRQDLLENLARKHKINKHFAYIQGSVVDKRQSIVDHLTTIGGTHPDAHVLFVGDMAHDLEAARHVSIASGLMISPYADLKRTLPLRPTFVFQSPSDILALCRSLDTVRPKKHAKPHPVTTVSALVFNKKGEAFFTLSYKWGHCYGIPGGKIDKDESALEALKREFIEETGLKLAKEELVLLMEDIHPATFFVENSHFLYLNYLAKTRTRDVILNDEAAFGIWLTPELAQFLPLNPPTRLLIEGYLSTTSPSSRVTSPSCADQSASPYRLHARMP